MFQKVLPLQPQTIYAAVPLRHRSLAILELILGQPADLQFCMGLIFARIPLPRHTLDLLEAFTVPSTMSSDTADSSGTKGATSRSDNGFASAPPTTQVEALAPAHLQLFPIGLGLEV